MKKTFLLLLIFSISCGSKYNENLCKNETEEDYENTVIEADKWLESDPENCKILYDKGMSLFKLKRFEEAIESFSMILKIDKNYPNVYWNRGICYHILGRKDESCSDFQNCSQEEKNNITMDNQKLKDHILSNCI